MSNRLIMALSLALVTCLVPLSAQENTQAQPTSGKFNFRLRNATQFSGYRIEEATIDLLVGGLKLKVPVPLVEMIRFDDGQVNRIRLQLNNAESLSGQMMPSQLGVIAEWGTLKLNSQAVAQVSRTNEPSPTRAANTTTTNSTAVVPAAPSSSAHVDRN